MNNWLKPFLFLLSIFFAVIPATAQRKKTDSLYKIWLNTELRDTSRLDALSKFTKEILYVDPDSAITLANIAREMSIRIKNDKYHSNALSTLGVSNVFKGNYAEAKKFFKEGIIYAERSGDKKIMANVYGNYGSLCRLQSNLIESIEYQRKALKLKEEAGDRRGVAVSLINIGNLFIENKEYKKAIEYFEKGYKIAESVGDKSSMALALANSTTIYNEEDNYKRSMENLQKAYNLRKEIGDKIGQVTELYGLGTTSKLLKEYASSLNYLKQAEALSLEINDGFDLTKIYTAMCNDHLLLGNKSEALKYAKMSAETAAKEESMDSRRDAATSMYHALKANGKKGEALDWYEKAISLADSLTDKQKSKEFMKKQFEFDYEKKQQADSLKRAQETRLSDLKHEQKLKQQKLIIYIAISGFVLMAVIAVLVFKGLQQKKRSNKQLEEINREVLKQKHIVEEKQKEILDSINYAKRIQNSLLPNDKFVEKEIKRLSDKNKES